MAMFQSSNRSLLTFIIVLILSCLTLSFNVPSLKIKNIKNTQYDQYASLIVNHHHRSGSGFGLGTESGLKIGNRSGSLRAYAYTDIKELNDAIRSKTTPAYDLFTQQEGVFDMSTVYVMAEVLIQKTDYESLENVLYEMRSKYGMEMDPMVWEIIILEACKKDQVIGKKYFNRMVKHGPHVTTTKTYETLIKSFSKSENWKEVTNMYNCLALREELLIFIEVGFYEMMMSYDSKRGRWKEAVFWMNEIDRRGLSPSHKCYRFVIDSCQKGGKQALAMEYIDTMLEVFKDLGSIDEEAV